MRADSRGQAALLLLDVIDVLNRENIPYAVIGALAVSFYGIVRASLDADAVISIEKDETAVNRLKKTLSGCGFKVIVKQAGSHDPLMGVMLIEDKFANQVDLILGVRGMDEDAFARIKEGSLQGEKMKIIGPEDLIAMKIFAGGPKDIDDVKGVFEVSGKDIDRKLLRRLTSRYGKQASKTLEGLLGKSR